MALGAIDGSIFNPFEIKFLFCVYCNFIHFSTSYPFKIILIYFKEKIENTNLVFISGSEKLIQNKLVQATLTILKLNTPLKQEVTEFDIRVILSNVLGIPVKYCNKIIESFNKTKSFIDFDFKDDIFNKNYKNLLDLIKTLAASQEKLSEQVCTIYETIFNSD